LNRKNLAKRRKTTKKAFKTMITKKEINEALSGINMALREITNFLSDLIHIRHLIGGSSPVISHDIFGALHSNKENTVKMLEFLKKARCIVAYKEIESKSENPKFNKQWTFRLTGLNEIRLKQIYAILVEDTDGRIIQSVKDETKRLETENKKLEKKLELERKKSSKKHFDIVFQDIEIDSLKLAARINGNDFIPKDSKEINALCGLMEIIKRQQAHEPFYRRSDFAQATFAASKQFKERVKSVKDRSKFAIDTLSKIRSILEQCGSCCELGEMRLITKD
jgi:hypothetical protein